VTGPFRCLWLRAALVFTAAFAFLHLLQFQTAYILGYDGYFHIKYARLLPSIGFVRQFKWAAHSIWATHFADKELLYHVFLVPFAWFGDLAVGLKYATVLLGAAAVVSFYLVLSLNKLRFPLVWTVLLCSAGPYFLHRLGAPRPHLLSITLLLWSVHLIINRKRIALAIVSVIYSLSYTAFHLPLALSLVVSGQLFVTERKLDWRTPLTILGAVVIGMLVNPYFPNNLRIFWLQNFLVPWMALQGGPGLALAEEFYPLSISNFFLTHLAVTIPLLAAICLAFARPRRLDAKTLSLLAISAVLLLMGFIIRRFVEYAVPLGLFFLASFYTDYLSAIDPRAALAAGGRRRYRAVGAIALLIIALGGLLVKSYIEALPLFTPVPPMRREAALYLEEHTEPDELVFTCEWDDSPELFYFNDRNRYPVLLDPNFMCYRDPELCREWSKVARGGYAATTYDVLARDYRYGVCTFDFERLKEIVELDPRMEIVLDSGGAYVFRIDRDNPEISLDRFLEMAPDR
jgi:hypothetical protein